METPRLPCSRRACSTDRPRSRAQALLGAGRRGLALGAFAIALGASAMALASAACSLVVDTEADQCVTDADCAARGGGFVGRVCSPQKICVVAVDAPNGGCTSTAQCIEQLGDNHVCRRADGACVPLLSDDCKRVVGDYTNDEALFVGAVLPSTGESELKGIAMQNSVELAVEDFQSASNGLPPTSATGATRPVVLVQCSDAKDATVGVRAARHLVDGLRVPAIIGPAFSGITLKVATEVTVPAGVLLMSPSSTSASITTLADNGLVWRTSPSDVLQADALAKLMPQLEAEVRARFGLGQEPIRVAMIHKGDSYGKGLADALTKSLEFNGKSALDNGDAGQFLKVDYGNPDSPDAQTAYVEARTKIFGQKPHVMLLFGTLEVVTEIFQKVEDQWETSGGASQRPLHVFSDGGQVPQLWSYLQANDPDGSKRKRVLGTVPGTNNDNYKLFRNRYEARFNDGNSPNVFGTAGAYDSLYLIAYAAAAAGAAPITGATLAANLKRMVQPGKKIAVGATGIGEVFALLAQGGSFDFDGASGPLNFDLATGEAPSDIQFWCVPKGSDGTVKPAVNSGAAYDAAKQSVPATAFATLTTSCGF